MLTCSTPGSPVALSISDNPKRKYPHTLEMVKSGHTWIGVNTARTNKLVAEAINKGLISEFQNIDRIKPEVKVSAHTRLDLQLFHGDTSTYVEVKNCSLAENNCAMFPDAVTARGTKHLEELTKLVLDGKPSCIFFLIQRMDADHFRPAGHIDPKYTKTLYKAVEAGVQALAYQAEVTPRGINIARALRIEL